MPKSKLTTLSHIIQDIERLQNSDGFDGLLCGALIMEAKNRLMSALRANEHEEQEEARDHAEARRVARAENGHPD